jgi:hypothetical protein
MFVNVLSILVKSLEYEPLIAVAQTIANPPLAFYAGHHTLRHQYILGQLVNRQTHVSRTFESEVALMEPSGHLPTRPILEALRDSTLGVTRRIKN